MFTTLCNLASHTFPGKPKFTEKDLPDLNGKVYIVTGANTGVGKELAQILYSKHAKVYVAARSEEKALAAIESIKAATPDAENPGELVFLRLDLADLTTIKASAEEFLSKESKLHVLFNNAGILAPHSGLPRTPQGYELHLGVNNIGTFMFTKLLTPILAATAKTEPPNTVRVIWVSSSGAEGGSYYPGGVNMDNLDYHKSSPHVIRYCSSKAGNYLHATEYARRHRSDGIVSVALNPGNLNSDLYRDQWAIIGFVIRNTVLHPSIFGAYTELWAGLSPEVTLEKSGEWIAPWGRFIEIRPDLLRASKSEAVGGTGVARNFWDWNEEQVKSYL